MDKAKKKIALLHRHPRNQIPETNAAFPYLEAKGMKALTFKHFDRLNGWGKLLKSIAWVFYAPCLVLGRGYDVIYCDDSIPFYPILVKLASPRSRVVLRIGDLHLMYYASGVFYKLLHFVERTGWNLADEIIAISPQMAEYISRRCSTRVSVVYDPVDPIDFPVRKTVKIDKKIVMFHGLLTKNKGVGMLLQAAGRLPEYQFWIVGGGPEYKRLKETAPLNTFFWGWYPFRLVYQLIEDCDVGVALRSGNPGNEYVVTSPFLQYGIMGKPCLVSRRKVFGDYPWQFSGVGELCEKIHVLMERPEEGKELQDYVLRNHHAKKIGDDIWRILTSR